MFPSQIVLKTGFAFLLISFGLSGCGSKPALKPFPPVTDQLRMIGIAYVKATMDMDRPPTKKEELFPYLKKVDNPDNPQNPADYFRSLSDGEEFVIFWGFDVRTVNLSGHPKFLPIIAYEKNGADGKRYALQVRFPVHVTDEELAELPFPRGFKRP